MEEIKQTEIIPDVQEVSEPSKPTHPWPIMISIIIAGAIIGISIVYAGSLPKQALPLGEGEVQINKTVLMKSVSPDEHILGKFDADLKLIVYSDLECPFCKTFHATMKKIMEEYGPPGKVVWIYRHYVLAQIHPRAIKEAEATECANEQGGVLTFWQYTDRIFQITKSNNTLDPEELINTAKHLNLDMDKFTACLNSGKYAGAIQESTKDAEAAGAKGTPYTIIITKDGQGIPLSGALPYAKLKDIIESLLKT